VLETPVRRPDRARADRLAGLYALHGPPIRSFLTRLTGGAPEQAEDLLQETMMRAWRHLESVPRDDEEARRWLYTVARRITVDAVRMRKNRPVEVFLYDLEKTPHYDDAADGAIASTALHHAFTLLTDPHREVLHELHVKGRSIQETARRLDVPMGTVRSRAYYAIRALRAGLSSGG
jgi:RNA polymerase sigma-70 factor (ECF subfamily)